MKRIATTNAPAALGPYAQAVDTGDTVYCSGQLGLDPATGALAEGVQAQTHQALKNLQAVLQEAGLTLDNVVKTTVFVQDLGDFGTVNEIYGTYFHGGFPARYGAWHPQTSCAPCGTARPGAGWGQGPAMYQYSAMRAGTLPAPYPARPHHCGTARGNRRSAPHGGRKTVLPAWVLLWVRPWGAARFYLQFLSTIIILMLHMGAFSCVCFCKALHWDNEPGGQSVSAFEKNICSERIVPCRRPARQHCPHKPTARRIPLKKRLGGHVL